MNKADKQYALNLEHILQNFSTIFCLEDSGMLEEESLKKEGKEKLKKDLCTGGGTGRHKGLKIPRPKKRAGPSPASGTTSEEACSIPFPRFP